MTPPTAHDTAVKPPTAGEPVTDAGDSPARPGTVPAPSIAGDDEPLTLVRIGAEPDPEPYPEDRWIPGSRRPDRRVLVIGVVVIAGLLAVASTAWLVGTNQPQAGGAHGGQLSQPSQLGSDHAQPSQALSGHPAPSLAPTSQPAPAQTSTGQAQPGQSGHSRSGHSQVGGGQHASGRSSTGHSSTGNARSPHPGSGQAGTHHPGSGPGSGQPGTSRTGTGHAGPGQTGPGQPGSSPAGPGQPGSTPAGPGQPGSTPAAPGQSGHSGSGPAQPGRTGTVRGTTPPAPAPHPRRAPPGPGRGGMPRHSAHGIVSIGPGLAGRAGVARVTALLDRYFAAVNHRAYQAYARLFAQRRQLTPREFAWGYQTTHDSNAVLAGVAPLKGGLKATVTFTSHQDPAGSPDHSSCIVWRITLFLHRAGPVYLIGMPPTGYRAGLRACRFAPRHPAQGHSGQQHARHPRSRRDASRHSASNQQAVPGTGLPRARRPRTGAPSTSVPGTSNEKTVRDHLLG